MWESPVNVIYGEMQTQIEGEIYKAIQNVGIDVNKEELLKALQYDREQYSKGYSDGYANAIDEFSERLKKHLNQFDFWKYGITDGTNCEMRNYDYMIDEIAEQMKGGVE